MTISVVTLENNHLFLGNPLLEQHRLRYSSIIERQNWEVPHLRKLEYDEYDYLASTYLIYLDKNNQAKGVTRLCPTNRKYMLKEHFSHMIDNISTLPESESIWEGSRFCISKEEPVEVRKRIAHELILAYLEHGLNTGIEAYTGIMYPIYWKHLFLDLGWKPEWLGEPQKTGDGKTSRAGIVRVSKDVLQEVRNRTKIFDTVVYYGDNREVALESAA